MQCAIDKETRDRGFLDKNTGLFYWKNLVFQKYLSKEQIDKENVRIAQEITRDMKGKKPLFICVLNGSFVWLTDVMRLLEWYDFEVEFVRFSTYSDNESSGKLKEFTTFKNMKVSAEGRHVIIFEDIVESGTTMKHIMDKLQAERPLSIKAASFLWKKSELKEQSVVLDYVAFQISPEFVFGYGLDVDEMARNVPEVYHLKEKIVE